MIASAFHRVKYNIELTRQIQENRRGKRRGNSARGRLVLGLTLFLGRLALGARLIRIDVDPGQLTRNALPEVAILSDAGFALQALERELEDYDVDQTTATARAQALREQLQGLLDKRQRLHQRFMAAVQQALPGVIVVGDSTQPVYSANLFYEPEQPRSYFNSSTGYGTLGYALPAALGAKLARSERPVVALIGDGGLQFTMGELATAVELVLADGAVAFRRTGQEEPAFRVSLTSPMTVRENCGYDIELEAYETERRPGRDN